MRSTIRESRVSNGVFRVYAKQVDDGVAQLELTLDGRYFVLKPYQFEVFEELVAQALEEIEEAEEADV